MKTPIIPRFPDTLSTAPDGAIAAFWQASDKWTIVLYLRHMPITDPSLPIRFLDILQATGLRFVVLHREAELGSNSLESDLDLAVDHPADDVIRRMVGDLKSADLHPVIRWPYDIGGAVTFFLSTEAGDHGIQVDLLHDPRGKGRYGLRTGELQKRAVSGKRYPVPDPLDERLYHCPRHFYPRQWKQKAARTRRPQGEKLCLFY